MQRNKYHARKCVVDGITFDSQKEAGRYRELRLLERAGKIKDLELQVAFLLLPAQYGIEDGQYKCLERELKYIADFVYLESREGPNGTTWSKVVEDAKGVKTEVYKIKRKLLLKFFGLRIREV